MARKTKEESEKTKEILLAAAEYLFLQKGVASTSLEDIARHAGMTRGAVYWHFENKQALFNSMHERVCLPFEQDFQQVLQADNPLQALYDHCIYVMHHITHDERMRNIVTILLLKCEETDPTQSNVERMRREREDIIRQFSTAFAKAANAKEIAQHITPEIAAMTLHALIHGMIYDSVSNENPQDILAKAPHMLDIFFSGLRQPFRLYNNGNQPCGR